MPSSLLPLKALRALVGYPDSDRIILPRNVVLDGAAHDGAQAPERFRVVSYNIRYLLNQDPAPVAAFLRAQDANVICLQEVLGEGQVEVLASALGWQHVALAPTILRRGTPYGLAVLSRHPFLMRERVELGSPFAYEPRVALHVTVRLGARRLHVVNVHADFIPAAMRSNVRDVLRHVRGHQHEPLLLLGDFNATAGNRILDEVRGQGLHDLFHEHAPEQLTFPAERPDRRIDYAFVSAALRPAIFAPPEVPNVLLSDHLPVAVTLAPQRLG